MDLQANVDCKDWSKAISSRKNKKPFPAWAAFYFYVRNILRAILRMIMV